jgi:phage shock protein C
MLLGVCKGLARYFDFSLTWVRVITVVAFIFTGFWPVGVLYLLAALVMRREPEPLPAGGADQFMSPGRLKRTYHNLEKRLRNLEDAVTRREFDWETRHNL